MDEFEEKLFDLYDIRKRNQPHQPRVKKKKTAYEINQSLKKMASKQMSMIGTQGWSRRQSSKRLLRAETKMKLQNKLIDAQHKEQQMFE